MISIIEYVWMDGSSKMRNKTKVMHDKLVSGIEDVPLWNYDGSSTGQAVTENSEVILAPIKLYNDPFRKGSNTFIVLCESWRPGFSEPVVGCNRHKAAVTLEQAKEKEPWFGYEIEFYLFDLKTHKPVGFPASGAPPVQGQFYCSVGSQNAFGRDVIEEQMMMCLNAGILVTGYNLEVAVGQLEYQVFGHGIDAPDDCWMSRYILDRVCEKHGLYAEFTPKPFSGDVNGSGLHTNFSTTGTREEGGMKVIEGMMEKLAIKHKEHLAAYGEGNELRLTGSHETSSMKTFSYGTSNRAASVRIPTETAAQGKGYFEDRRPASTGDYWVIAQKIVETTCL